uniref:Fibroblast growth factor binding protein 3 n=1 Tax=Leptobrachium leishanense TaxID=445787 RepID=A0A8C5N0P2_9ANUR
MRLFSVILLIVFINCLNTLQGVFGKNEKGSSKKAEKQSFARSGQLSTKHQHECTWEITGDLRVSLSLSCHDQANSSYQCTYEGEPQKCSLYNIKAKQYWKQILGKFKKLKSACEENTLKSRICKKIVGDAVEGAEEGNKEKSRPKESKKGSRPNVPDANENVGAEKKNNDRKKKTDGRSTDQADPPSPSFMADLPPTAGVVNDDMELNEDLAASYCAENWHSVCSFFVNFWNG